MAGEWLSSRWIAWLAVVSLAMAISWMKLVPDGPRPTTTLSVSLLSWVVLAALVAAFLGGSRFGWVALVGLEAFNLTILALFGIADIRAAGGMVLGAASLGLLLMPGSRSHAGVGPHGWRPAPRRERMG